MSGPWELERIAIIGAGSMGTALAAMLGRIAPVVLVCRNAERAAAVVRDGAILRGRIEAVSMPIVVRSVAQMRALGRVDAVFVATKTTAIPQVAAELREVLAAQPDRPPLVISFQNGIEPGRWLLEQLGGGHVVRMVLSLAATMDPASGIVRLTMNHPPHVIGSLDPALIPACEAVAAMLTAAGLETVRTDDIERDVWRKGIINAAVNPVAALVNGTVGDVLAAPARMIVELLLREGVAVARAEGIRLPDDFEQAAWALLDKTREHTPSMVEDIRNGRESEIGQLNRQIMAHGRRVGVATPTHDIIDALIETFDWRVYLSASAAGLP